MTKQEILDLININLISGSKIPAIKHREVEYALLDAIFSIGYVTGDIKEVDCSNQYIIDNFEPNGLGKNERIGWAICNGQNGTTDRGGRVSMPYGTGYLTARAIGGEATHVLSLPEMPQHSHSIKSIKISAGAGGGTLPSPIGGFSATTEISGGGLAHNNLQPYIVTLFIQKI